MADDEKIGTSGKGQPRDFASDALALLNHDIRHNGWEFSMGLQKSFYVRGATWFHENVLRQVADIQKHNPENFNDIFARLPAFRTLPFGWNQSFSPRQAMEALSLRSRKPLMFHKAVQTILLCDHIVRERSKLNLCNVEEYEALRRMRIEPAVFYIQDFGPKQFDDFKRSDSSNLEALRSMTGQRSRVVFGEMAAGHTVTKDLAEKTRSSLIKLFPAIQVEIGVVDFGHPTRLAAALAESLPD